LLVLIVAAGVFVLRPPAQHVASDEVIAASSLSFSAPAASDPHAAGHTDYLTYHYDDARLGWNPHETVLNVRNVNPRTFGKLFDLHVDGQVYTQPLYAANVVMAGGVRHNVLVVATEHDSVYAFDADDGRPLWVHTFVGCCGVRPVHPPEVLPAGAGAQEGCGSVKPDIGVSSTPVIDPEKKTVYVVAKLAQVSGGKTTFYNMLYALALDTGRDRVRPVEITDSKRLSFHGLFSNLRQWRTNMRLRFTKLWVTFDPSAQYNRTALLLHDGNLYFGFGSHCDLANAHGWVFAYRADTLERVASFVTTRDRMLENGGGVWQAGFGISADPDGNVYAATGNAPFTVDRGGRDYGDSLLKLSPSLDVLDYFTPYTQQELDDNDGDFGGSGVVVLPDRAGPYPHLVVSTSKIRAIFLLNRDHLGEYHAGGPDHVLQVIGDDHDQTNFCIGTCGGPAYYRNGRGEYVYAVWAQDALRAYRLENTLSNPRLREVAHSPNSFPGSGGSIPSVSSDGARPGTAIVWATTRPSLNETLTQPIELFAYDAADVSKVLFSGDVSIWPNKVGHPFLTPTIADGRVFVGGDKTVSVFGLLHHAL
jgi:outer membrane protein assembly factor BamB